MNHFDPNIPNKKNNIKMQILIKIPLPATLFTCSLLFSPRFLESNVFSPIPVPTPIAIIKIWIGNANVKAWFAIAPCSPMFVTNMLSTTLYNACRTMEIIIGNPIFQKSFFIGMSAILFCLTFSITSSFYKILL